MGARLITIFKKEFPVHVVRNFDTIDDAISNRKSLLEYAYDSDVKDWRVARVLEMGLDVHFVDNHDPYRIYVTGMVPETVLSAFKALQQSKTGRWKRRQKKQELQEQARKLFMDNREIDAAYERMREDLLDMRAQYYMDWKIALESLPMFRADLPLGAVIVPVQGITY